MANTTLEFLLRTRKQGNALEELDDDAKKLADTLKNKLALATSTAQQSAIRLAEAEQKLALNTDPAAQAKLAHEVNRARVAFDGASQKADALQKELQGVGRAADAVSNETGNASLSITDFKSALDLASQGLQVLKQGWDATIAKAAQWGDDMGDLAQVTGQTVEATSEMAATLELLGIQSENLGTVIKTMTKSGLQLNLATLKQLSAEYQAIKDPVEQNEFLFKKFGKAGLDMAEVLGKSTEELERFSAAARTSGKVIDEATANAAENLNVELAILQQRVEGVAIAFGNKLIPFINDFIDTNDAGKQSMLRGQGVIVELKYKTEELVTATEKATIATRDVIPAQDAATRSSYDLREAYIQEALAAKDTAWMATITGTETRNLAQANRDAVDALGALQDKQAGWASSTGQDVIRALDAAGVEGREYHAALLAIDAQLGTSFAKDAEKKQKLDDLTKAYADGKISVGEYRDGLNLLYAKDMPETKAAFEQANDKAVIFEEQMRRMNGLRVQTFVDTVYSNQYVNPNGSGIIPGSGRAAGGPVSGGQPYIVGEQGPELFVPQQSGMIVPNQTINQNLGGLSVTINQQPGETADRLVQKLSTDLGRLLRNASNSGLARAGRLT